MAEHRRPLKRSREVDLAVVRDTLTDAVNRGDAALRAALEEKLCLVQGSGAALAARLSEPAVITELVRVLEAPMAGDEKLHERLQLTIHAPGSRSSSVASRSSKSRNVRQDAFSATSALQFSAAYHSSSASFAQTTLCASSVTETSAVMLTQCSTSHSRQRFPTSSGRRSLRHSYNRWQLQGT